MRLGNDNPKNTEFAEFLLQVCPLQMSITTSGKSITSVLGRKTNILFVGRTKGYTIIIYDVQDLSPEFYLDKIGLLLFHDSLLLDFKPFTRIDMCMYYNR